MKDTDPMNSTEELIRAVNPVRTSEVPAGDSPAARRLLTTLPGPAGAGPVPGRRRPAFRVRLAAGGAVVAAATAAIVAAVTLGGPASDGIVPVPLPVAGNLHALVLAAARQPAQAAPRKGQFQYTESISLNEVDTATKGKYFAADFSQHRQIWIGADGSGRIAGTNTNQTFPTPADLAKWIAVGRPLLENPSADDRYGPGQLTDGPGIDLTKLTTDPVKLAQLIASRKIEGGPPGAAEDFVQVGDLFRETDAPPALRAALLQVAAGIPGVKIVQNAHDHSGRPGIALVREQLVTQGPDKGKLDRSELIFDRSTSALLGESDGFVDPATGAVTYASWTVYLKSFVVASITSVTPVTSGG